MDYYGLSEGMATLLIWRRYLTGYRIHHFSHQESLGRILTDAVVIIIAGYVRQSYLDPQGREVVTALYGPGHIVGDPFHEYEGGRSQFRSKDTLQGWVLGHSKFLHLLDGAPQLAKALLKLSMLQARASINRFADFALADVPTRTARLLASLMSTHGSRCHHGHELDIRLTHQELCEMVGAARPVISGLLNQWRRAGIIDYTREFMCVEDLEGLNRLGTV